MSDPPDDRPSLDLVMSWPKDVPTREFTHEQVTTMFNESIYASANPARKIALLRQLVQIWMYTALDLSKAGNEKNASNQSTLIVPYGSRQTIFNFIIASSVIISRSTLALTSPWEIAHQISQFYVTANEEEIMASQLRFLIDTLTTALAKSPTSPALQDSQLQIFSALVRKPANTITNPANALVEILASLRNSDPADEDFENMYRYMYGSLESQQE